MFAGFDDVVEIGRGGFGVVFRARDVALGRTVAIKRLDASLDRDARERFQREAQAMSALSGHPNVLPLYSVGVDAHDRPYLVMPYLARGSLAAALGRRPLPWRDATQITIRLAGATESAHRVGVLHRDIKPDNVLRSDYDEPLLADFGIARVSGGFTTTDRRVTASVPYAAPEILGGGTPTPVTDVYALGATAYHLLSGRPPFVVPGEDDLLARYARIANGALADLRSEGVPDLVWQALRGAMAVLPADRPPTAAAFGELLQDAERGLGAHATEMALVSTPPSSPAADRSTVRGTEPTHAGGTAPTDLGATPPTHADGPTTTPAGGTSHTADNDRSTTRGTEPTRAGGTATADADGRRRAGATERNEAVDASGREPGRGSKRRRRRPRHRDRRSRSVVAGVVAAGVVALAVVAAVLERSGSAPDVGGTAPAGPTDRAAPRNGSVIVATPADLTPAGAAPALTATGLEAAGHVPADAPAVLRFAASPGTRAIARVAVGDGGHGPLDLRLLDAGSTLEEEPVTGTTAWLAPVLLPATGQYTLELSATDRDEDVRLAVSVAPADDEVTATVDAGPVPVHLASPMQRGRVMVRGRAGQRVRVTWQQTDGAASYVSSALVDPPDTELVAWSSLGSGTSDPVTLPHDGVFVVEVSFDGEATGAGTVAVSST